MADENWPPGPSASDYVHNISVQNLNMAHEADE
jgi:hypothetical protein